MYQHYVLAKPKQSALILFDGNLIKSQALQCCHLSSIRVGESFTTVANVNVDIFALLNFRTSSSRRHVHIVKFSRTYQLILFDLL